MMGTRTETVLLVDDEEFVRSFVRRILVRDGFTVLEAEHAESALNVNAGHQGDIHLLLTDVRMSAAMTGADLARQMRRLRPAIRVIYMSGFAEDPSVGRDVEAGTALFIAKPFTPVVLKRKVADCLAEPVRATP